VTTNVEVISLAVASLAAARSTDDLETATYYAATCRSALDAIEEQTRRMRVSLVSVEKELVRRGAPKQMTGANRNG
jgi:hypothetical protein